MYPTSSTWERFAVDSPTVPMFPPNIGGNVTIGALYTVQHKTLAGENFGGFGGSLPIRQSFIRQPTAKLRWIWHFIAFIANPPKFSPPIFLQFQLRQSFLPPKFCAVRYVHACI